MTRRPLHWWLSATLALAIGLVLRLWFVTHAARIDGDTLIYGGIAKNWIEHGVYGFAQSASGVQPTLIRLPGYPLFLMVCFRLFGIEHYTAVMYVQVVFDLLTCLLVSALAGRLFGRRAAIAALWLSALCPFTASYASAPLTETLSLTSIALTFYGVERWREARWRTAGLGLNRWLWITSAAMAYALLLRPEQGLLPAAVVPAMLWMSWQARNRQSAPFQALTPVILAAICVVLPLAPWALRNWHTFHVIQPLAPRYATDPGETVPLGFQRWYRTWAIDFASTEDVYWNYDGAAVEISDIPTRAFDSDDQYARTDALLNEYNLTDNSKPQFDARFRSLAEERIKADPLRYYVALPVARLLNMAFRPRTEMMPISLEWWKWSEHHQQTLFATAYAALNLAYFVLAGLGLWLWRRRGWTANPGLAWAMIAYLLLRCALLLTLDNSEPRYTLEFFPLFFVWSAILFTPTGDRSKDSSPA
jgi:4-amino-4-deoxy-L-arabinose transferase-like glycosyltransferase